MYKQVNVVMLPRRNTDITIGNLCVSPRYPNKLLIFGQFENSYANECIVQELYFTSSEEIKTGDIINDPGKSIVRCKSILDTRDLIWESFDGISSACDCISDFNKVIAYTNSSLKIPDYGAFFGGSKEKSLPQPSKEWIEYFVTEYNKGNIINSVEVEFEEILKSSEYSRSCFEQLDPLDVVKVLKLKINPDNIIDIKSSKNSYTREELVDLASEFDYDGDKKQFYGTSFINKLFSLIGYKLHENCKIENI